MMYALRTFLNTALFGTSAILWLFFSGLAAGPFLWLFPGKYGRNVRKFVYVQSKGILFFVRACARKYRVQCVTRPTGPCVVVANHESALDLYTVAALGFSNVVYITKGWVFKLPFFRFVMNGAGYLDAEKTPPEEMLLRCRQAVENGCDIVLFPQGSRKNPQARFKSGAFYLAEKLNVPVIPVAIAGTGKILPPGSIWLHPADVLIQSIAAVRTQDFSGPVIHLEMARTVKNKIMEVVNKEEENEKES